MCLQWSSVAFKIYLANKSSDKHGGAKMRSRTHAARQKFEVCERFFFFYIFYLMHMNAVWQRLYVCATKNSCAQLAFTENSAHLD